MKRTLIVPTLSWLTAIACSSSYQFTNDAISFIPSPPKANYSFDCSPPKAEQPPALESPDSFKSLAGEYWLTVVPEKTIGPDSVLAGTLVLIVNRPQYSRAPNPWISHPLVGTTGVDFGKLGEAAFAHPADSRDPVYPGVQVTYDSGVKELYLVLGAAFNDRVIFIHSGLFFDVYSIDSGGFFGRWQAGYAAYSEFSELPAGYFCATRVALH